MSYFIYKLFEKHIGCCKSWCLCVNCQWSKSKKVVLNDLSKTLFCEV